MFTIFLPRVDLRQNFVAFSQNINFFFKEELQSFISSI